MKEPASTDICATVRKAARKDKENWLKEQHSSIENATLNNRCRQTYQLIKKINKTWKPRQTAIADKHGKILQDKGEVKKRWTEYCSELYKITEDNSEIIRELEEITPPSREDEEEDILLAEVEAAINKLKNYKAPGIDRITGEIVKAGGEALTKRIPSICNQAWREGKIPVEWTRSIIVAIPKKGDLSDCSNYRTIALMNHMSKVLMTILLERMKSQVEEHLSEEQAGFRKDRNTTQQILILRLIAEKAKRKGRLIHNCFIDFQKAFDSVRHDILQATLKSFGVGRRLTQMINCACVEAKSAVRVGGEIGEWFNIAVGAKQGDPISPTSFITYLERVMEKIKSKKTGISIHGTLVNNLIFADDIDLIEENIQVIQENVETLRREGEAVGLKINNNKTKTMTFGKRESTATIKVNDEILENVEEFVYLGSLLTWNNDCGKEIARRIAKAAGAMAAFGNIWRSREISIQTKVKIITTCIFSVLLYACETWTMRTHETNKLLAFEMRCYRRILHIRWQQKITNKEVRKRVGNTKNIKQLIMERKLNFFGHVCRMNNNRLIKQTIFGMIDGAGIRGRPCREWLDDVRDWCEMDIHKLSRMAQERDEWRKMVKHAIDTNGH